MATKIAVVTGSNKGIGFAIVKGLCEKFDGDVYLTARNVTRGEEAVQKLKSSGRNPLFHQLDIMDKNSIAKFADFIKEKGGVDLLVNNAAIYNNDDEESTITVNYFALLHVCEALFPYLKENARVVNISSSAGHLSRIPNVLLRKQFSNPNLTVSELNNLMKNYQESVKAKKNIEDGWGDSAYVVSKVAVSALTIIQQRQLNEIKPSLNISVNSVHPGYVDTDMTNHTGTLTIEEGAIAPLYLAIGDHNLKGEYVWCDCKIIDWYADTVKSKLD